jgi:peptide/nickel transport system permease protein
VGVGAVVLALVPATIIGVLSAYIGGAFDYMVGRVVDAVQAIPGLILLIAIMVVLGGSITNVIIALAIPSMISDSRVTRGATMQVSRAEYVTAARALGATDLRLMSRHILPNITSPIIVIASLSFGQFILAEATLSFLGFGIQAPAPSWGNMLSAEGRAYMFAAPWLLWGPAIALSLVVFGANMFGDALRDVLDPRLKGTGGKAHYPSPLVRAAARG